MPISALEASVIMLLNRVRDVMYRGTTGGASMKIEKVTFKNYLEVPSEGLVRDHGVLVPTHQGKESGDQRRRLETEQLIEDGPESCESEIT
jgi:hypothetical protein